MSPDSPRAPRAGLRLLAAAAAGCTAAAAFAVPAAAAEIPGITGDPVVDFALNPSVVAGETGPGSITVDYTPAEGSENATHIVAAEFTITGSDGVVELTAGTDDPNAPVGFASCDASAYTVTCVDSDADANTVFGFDLGAVPSAEDETFGYTLKVTVDGIEVAGRTGTFDVKSTYDVHQPYAHGDVAITGVEGGTNASVKPVIYQDFDLAPTAAAVVVSFTDALPGALDTSGLATAVAEHDNCKAAPATEDPGIVCVITEFPEAKGQFLTFTDAITYAIADDVVGPLDVCGCRYSVETVNAETLASEYDFLDSTDMSGTTLGLTTASEGWTGGEESVAYYKGGVTLTTRQNRYNLDVDEIDLKGSVGDTVTVATTVANGGSAAADDLHPEGNSYLVRAQLPQGTELVRVDSDGTGAWECYGADELAAVHRETTGTALERFDLACAIDGFEPGETVPFSFTVKLTDTSAFQGAIEVGAVYEPSFEGAYRSDFALIYNEAVEIRYDYNGDGYEDLFVVRKSDGALRFYPGTSAGTYQAGVTAGTGWNHLDLVMAGDLTGDDRPDLLARDNKTGTLYTYPGNGKGGYGTRISVGTGWNKMGQISVGNYDGDGNPDIFATAFSDGNLYFYPGLGNGRFGAREIAGEQWDGYDVITSIGDLDDDGLDEFLTRWNTTGVYFVLGSQGDVYEYAQDLHYSTDGRRFDQVVGVGDLKRDGKAEIAGVDVKTGQLVVRHLDLSAPGTHTETVVGSSGWNAVRLPVIELDRNYDYDGDGYSDWIAQRKSDGDVRLYFGTGKGHDAPWTFCDDCNAINAMVAGGDYAADGRLDWIVRTTAGELYTVRGIDDGEHYGFAGEDVYVGSGWNGMGTITGGHDYNSDGKDDLVAVHSSTGNLYLYPGRGDGKFGARSLIGNGWNGMREVTAVGDLDHNGHADLLAISKSDACLYFYNGTGAGKFKSRVNVGCGWKSYEAITGVGDFNRDGHADFLSRRVTDGYLFLYPGNGAGGHGTRVTIGSGWNAMNIA